MTPQIKAFNIAVIPNNFIFKGNTMKNLLVAINDTYSLEYTELLTKIDHLQRDAEQCSQHIATCKDAKMAYDLIQYEIEKLVDRCEDIRKIPMVL